MPHLGFTQAHVGFKQGHLAWFGEPAPLVQLCTPYSGSTAGNTAATITGQYFVTGATVTFGGNSATSVVVVNSGKITCHTPAHATGGVNIVVTNPDGQKGTLYLGYYYGSFPPTVTYCTPLSGGTGGGTACTVSGGHFVNGATITFGGVAATNVVWVNATILTCNAPAHAAGAVDIEVTNPDLGHGTLTNGFTYVAGPAVDTFSPALGAPVGGTAVTIYGSGFVAGATVNFGAPATGVTVVNAGQITCTTPAGGADTFVAVTVTNPGGASATAPNSFYYTGGTQPVITSDQQIGINLAADFYGINFPTPGGNIVVNGTSSTPNWDTTTHFVIPINQNLVKGFNWVNMGGAQTYWFWLN